MNLVDRLTNAAPGGASKRRWRPAGVLLLLCCALGLQAPLAQAEKPAGALALAESTANAARQSAPSAGQSLRDAQQTVQNITDELLALITDAQRYVDQDEGRFYKELGELLRRYVDFPSFSRAVMGKYASGQRIESLSPEQRAKLEAQIQRFNDVFSGALIGTYGKGLLVFEGERIEVLEPPAEDAKHAAEGKAIIKQLIHGDRPEPYVIYYSLRRDSDGAWRIRNMIIESSNLGKIYRNQFDNAYKVYEGDIDRVIDNWVAGANS